MRTVKDIISSAKGWTENKCAEKRKEKG